MYKVVNKYYILFFAIVVSLVTYLYSNIEMYVQSNNPDKYLPLVVLKIKPCEYNNEYSFIDSRDNKRYKQVQIGNQCWMAENLNYGEVVPNMEQKNNKKGEKTFYQNDTSNGEKFGAMYTWEEAVNYQDPGSSRIIKGLCPDGWHIPTDKEWSMLTNFLDPTCISSKIGWSGSNIALLVIDGSDFNAKNGGNAVSGWFFYINKMSYFWTSSRYSSASAWYRSFAKGVKQIYRGPGDIKIGMSVRCVKDQ